MLSDIIRLTVHPDNAGKTIAITTINVIMTFISEVKNVSDSGEDDECPHQADDEARPRNLGFGGRIHVRGR